jgi:8-oxo-dGTP pyrophosphatase MutT (NUDIX family)
MDQHDILFKTDGWVFSYRIAGVLINDGKVLLQRPIGGSTYALPGGHANFGEESEETVAREFKEEIGIDITPVRLLWIGENFFPWEGKNCHQICLYYLVAISGEAGAPLDGSFFAQDEMQGKVYHLEFSWIPIRQLRNIAIYPALASEKLVNLAGHIERFVYREVTI